MPRKPREHPDLFAADEAARLAAAGCKPIAGRPGWWTLPNGVIEYGPFALAGLAAGKWKPEKPPEVAPGIAGLPQDASGGDGASNGPGG